LSVEPRKVHLRGSLGLGPAKWEWLKRRKT